jgi:hypothetical protein
MPQWLLRKDEMLKCSQRRFSQPTTYVFSQITRSSQRGVGESSQRLRMSVFHGWHQQPPKEGGESFYTCPPKTSCWKLASKNWNIRYLEASRWSSSAQTGPFGLGNQTIWFYLVQWDVECVWPLCFTHLTWVFRLLLSMRLCWQSM